MTAPSTFFVVQDFNTFLNFKNNDSSNNAFQSRAVPFLISQSVSDFDKVILKGIVISAA